MLRVTVELLPFGDEIGKFNLGVIEIGNVKTIDDLADYIVRADIKDFGPLTTTVRNHERAKGWRALVSRALDAIDWRMHK